MPRQEYSTFKLGGYEYLIAEPSKSMREMKFRVQLGGFAEVHPKNRHIEACQ